MCAAQFEASWNDPTDTPPETPDVVVELSIVPPLDLEGENMAVLNDPDTNIEKQEIPTPKENDERFVKWAGMVADSINTRKKKPHSGWAAWQGTPKDI